MTKDISLQTPPIIGIALGSGSAKGWAHIGVINALEHMGIRPSIVVGTSIGALVGAAYAADRIDKLSAWVNEISWTDTFSYLDLTVLRGGLIQGDRVLDEIEREIFGDILIEELSKPFATVATHIDNGNEIWFKKGSVRQAVRASIALPGLFTPVKIEERWLIDGGLVNPIPISLCREMGADIVIGVNLTSDKLLALPTQDIGTTELVEPSPDYQESSFDKDDDSSVLERVSTQLLNNLHDHKDMILSKINLGEPDTPSVIEVFSQTIRIMQDQIARNRMKTDPADIMLTPKLGSIGMMDFHKARESIQEGEASVYRVRSQLEELLGK